MVPSDGRSIQDDFSRQHPPRSRKYLPERERFLRCCGHPARSVTDNTVRAGAGTVLAFHEGRQSIRERMSDTTAISAALPSPPGPAPQAGATRQLSDDVDLYAEGFSFSEQTRAGPGVEALFGKDGFDFKDVLDIVNPLHHLPVVGTIYRALTGDELAPGPRILGGTLFGGIAGFVTAIANAVYENETGKDMGDSALALFTDDAAPGTAVAGAAPANSAATGSPAPETLAAAILPTASSPLAIAGHAKSAGVPHNSPAGIPASIPASENEDPTAALIRARVAVPATRRSGIAGHPATDLRSSLAVAGGKTLPIQFQSKAASAAAPVDAPVGPHAAAGVAADSVPDAGRATVRTPHVPRPPTGHDSAPGDKVAAETAPEVAVLMKQALDKYETLMKGRTAPSISSEI